MGRGEGVCALGQTDSQLSQENPFVFGLRKFLLGMRRLAHKKELMRR